MDNTLNMEGQCFVPIDTAFAFASSPDAPVTPTSSPRSDWMESVPLNYNDLYNNAYYWTNTACPVSSFMSDSACSEIGSLPYHHIIHQQYVDMDYQHLPYTSKVDVGPISPFPLPSTPGTGESYFNVGTILSPSTMSRSGSIASMPSLSCSSDTSPSVISERRVSDVSNCLGQDPYPHNTCSPQGSSSICDTESPPETHKLADETPMSLQRKVPKSRKQTIETIETSAFRATVIKRATGACDYPGCNKAFRRIEHLKRHKQTHHSEGENNFVCEFCGKDQFNRYDNLQTHRRLHARHNKRYRSIKFVPAAVAVIEEEDRTRKRRVTHRSKGMTVHDWRVQG